MARIVVPDNYPPVMTGSRGEERLRQLGEVEIYSSDCEGPEELLCRVGKAEAIVNIRARCRFPFSRQEISESLRLSLGQLPPDQQEVIFMRYFAHFSHAQIAEATSRPSSRRATVAPPRSWEAARKVELRR